MAEPKLAEFKERVARYERARRQGFGFETDSTLGRSFFLRRKRRNPVRFLIAIAAVLVTFLVLKAAIIIVLGEPAYTELVARMNAGHGINRLGAAILQADPVSSFIIDLARIWMPKFKDFVLQQ